MDTPFHGLPRASTTSAFTDNSAQRHASPLPTTKQSSQHGSLRPGIGTDRGIAGLQPIAEGGAVAACEKHDHIVQNRLRCSFDQGSDQKRPGPVGTERLGKAGRVFPHGFDQAGP